jgi:hypothetical protein
MNSTLDFLAEIIPCRPQGVVSPILGAPPSAIPLDITSKVIRQGFGSINRAMERDLLSFKTGDLTLTARNTDGYFDDLFAFFGSTDIWSLRIQRRGTVQFWGCLIGKGSITFDRKAKTCQVTAYGLTKLLDMTSAETIARTVAAMTVTSAAGGATSITLNSTSGLLSGDVLHVTDHNNSEDITVKQVTSATVATLNAALTNSYAAGTAVTLSTPFYRFKSVSYLVNALFTAAGIGVSEFLLSNSQFSRLAPTPVNLSGLSTFSGSDPSVGDQVTTNPCERNGVIFETFGGDGTYYQPSPDAAWVKDDATLRSWVDWSRYYTQAETGPSIILRDADTIEAFDAGSHKSGWDYRPATKTQYQVDRANQRILSRTSTDGTTWTGFGILIGAGLIATMSPDGAQECGCELDTSRGLLYFWSGSTFAGNPVFGTYDLGSTVQTSLRQSGDTNNANRYGGMVYVPELDCIIGLRSLAANGTGAKMYGTQFHIVAYRGNTLLWERAFPDCLVADYAGGPPGVYYNYPTSSLRYVNGGLYVPVVSDGKAQLVVSFDQFQTYTMRALTSPGVGARIFGARVAGMYRISCWDGTLQSGKFIGAPFYAGVVEYADFTGMSIADALKKLSVLTNALFYIDDDLQGHFVARDLYDPGAVLDISDRVKEEQDDFLWDETAEYVTVSGNSIKATAGDAGFATEGITLATDFLPTEAFAQALADSYYGFYSNARQQRILTVRDKDGTVFRPLNRVTPDSAIRYLVYESDHSLTDDEITVTLLEDK